MIRTDIDIKDGLFEWVKSSEVAGLVNGSVYKDARPLNSDKEDIVISVLTRDAGSQIQYAVANINVYVPDKRRGKEAIEDTARLRVLSRAGADDFEYQQTGGRIYELASQEIFKVNGIDWHVINNRINIRFSNE